MADGCYDINGKCVNCGQYHPCSCEIEPTPKDVDSISGDNCSMNSEGEDYEESN